MLHQKIVETPFKLTYGNYIGGEWRQPIGGKYFDNLTPVTGGKLCEVARSDERDIEAALDAAHAAKDQWGRTSTTERANILTKIAQRMEDNLELLARAETLDNGKPIRETMAADIPLAIDHFRYFAACIRAQEGSIGEIDQDTWVAMGAAAQREVLNTIEAKIRLYREFDSQRDLWVSFDGGRVPGDAVYPVPLSALP